MFKLVAIKKRFYKKYTTKKYTMINKIRTKHLYIPCLLLISINCKAQLKLDTIIKTPVNGHKIYSLKNSNEKSEKYFVDDQKKPFSGVFIEKGWDGELISSSTFRNGLMNGEFKEWKRIDKIEFISKLSKYKNNLLSGEYIEWGGPNYKIRECFYDNLGELHGFDIIFEKNKPKVTRFYTHGKADSTWTWINSDGITTRIENHKNGHLHGMFIDFYENGKKKSEVNYLVGNKCGLQTEWDDQGNIYHTCNYSKNGEKHGKEIYYYANGKIKNEGVYENGNKFGKFIWYDELGNIKEETIFK
jgi:antitoxin component YwqK of YwqJK toxin-antitoxin module